jgi:hypothetical protein
MLHAPTGLAITVFGAGVEEAAGAWVAFNKGGIGARVKEQLGLHVGIRLN